MTPAPGTRSPPAPPVEVTTPGMVLVVDESGRLLDRSPRAGQDPELCTQMLGERVDPALLARADGRRLVHEGAALDALWFSRGEAPIEGGLSERDFGAMLERLRNLVGVLVASLDTEDMVGAGPVSSRIGTTRRREVDRIVEVTGSLAHAFAPSGARSFLDVELAIRRTLDQLRGSAHARGVRLRVEGQREARRVRIGDEAILGAGIAALLQNAIEARAHDGEVRVRVEGSKAAVTLTIEDDGPGLSPTERALGTPFATGKRGHVGLGLAVARRAAFLHGGELSVTNRGRGAHGVTATLWLPVAPG